MARITDFEELFFPVYTQPIFTRLVGDPLGAEVPISNKLAVLNQQTNAVLGIVSKDYRLVTNKQAYCYARKCAMSVFENTVEEEWDIFAADAPRTGSYCHLDLRHKTGKLDFDYVMVGTREGVPESYGPYIRVTNSYNAQRALRFTIGCYRKTCRNGMTAPEDLISFSFAHTRESIQSEIAFAVDHDRVRMMQQEFKDTFDDLRRFEFAKEHGRELVKVILAIRRPKNAEQEEFTKSNTFHRDWFRLEGKIESVYRKYADTLGDNAYSALQAATDLASHPIKNSCFRKDRDRLQRLAGEWMIEFKRECKEQEFDLAAYLKRPIHPHAKRMASGRAPA